MKKHAVFVFLAAVLVTFTESARSSDACEQVGDPADISSINGQREAFNQAIAEKDARVIASILHEEVVLVTGTDSDLYLGRDAQVAIWQEDFVAKDRAIYVRTPKCLRVSSVAPVALEIGSWRGEQVTHVGSFAAGSYVAKWRKDDGQWLVEAEVFSTEACGGRFCPGKAPQ